MMTVLFYSEDPISSFYCFFIYGPSNASFKSYSWAILSVVGNAIMGPWLLLGDFNAVLCLREKLGSKPFNHSLRSTIFQQLARQLGLIDIGFEGNIFTWSNGRHGLANIQEQLDRSRANVLWTQQHPKATLKHLVRSSSDHSPSFLTLRVYLYLYKSLFVLKVSWQGTLLVLLSYLKLGECLLKALEHNVLWVKKLRPPLLLLRNGINSILALLLVELNSWMMISAEFNPYHTTNIIINMRSM